MLPAYLKKNIFYKLALNIKKKFDQPKLARQEKQNRIKRLAFYRSFLRENDLVFDVGSNIGNRVEIFHELKCRIIAVEPQPSCITVLKNRFGNEITIEAVGLGRQEGKMEMFIADESTISTFSKEFIQKTQHSKFQRNKWESSIEVPITTLDLLIQKYALPAFCKIDVEGFEAEVLSGLSQPIAMISFEYNVPEMNANVVSCIKKLNTLSKAYKFNYSVGETMQLKLPTWMNYNEFTTFINSSEFMNSDFGDIYATLAK